MKLIPLTQGQFAKVSDEDYDELIKYKWHAAKWKHGFYARRHNPNPIRGGKKLPIIKMHRQILGFTDPKIFGDHKDGDTLNNQRDNLRPCSNKDNCKNQYSRKGVSSFLGVNRGVTKTKLANGGINLNIYWRAEIRVNKKGIFLKQFPFTKDGEILAAKTYDEAAKKYHGEFANLNFKD